MRQKNLPVLNINNFKDYNCCMDLESNFYVRTFSDHVRDNKFLDVSHRHDFYLVVLFTQGTGTHIIDFHEYDIEPGAMFILSPGQVHVWDLSDNIDGHILFFKKEYFLIDFNKDRLNRLPFFKSTFSKPYMKLNTSNTNEVAELYMKINQEYDKRYLQYHEMIRLHLNILFLTLARHYKAKQAEHFEYKYEVILLNRFEQLVDAHYRSHLSITDYADKMNISTKQLHYMCKKTIDKTPSELIQNRMALESKRLLVHSDLSVSAIAEELQFTDTSYFIRSFKKACKVTPDRFRMTHLSNTANKPNKSEGHTH